MTPERLKQIRELFEAALQREPAARAGFLAQATDDEQLRAEVLRMLAARAESPDFLQRPSAISATADTTAIPTVFPIGTRIAGRLEIIGLLGAGGMGEVYHAHDHKLHRSVALKVIAPGRAGTPDRKRRFLQEARAASPLSHPNIATVYDIAEDSGVEFISMEYVRGTSLDKLIPPKGLDVQTAIAYGAQIADALSAAHAAGVVHRDVKPGNVMVSDDHRVKVLDFGLAKLAGHARFALNTASTEADLQTEEGVIVGTVAYMSPEQAEGKPVDARSDIFSFGSVLYEMLCGSRPFRGESNVSTLAAILHKQPEPLRKLAPAVPPELDALVNRCLSKDADQRIQTAAEVAAALRGFAHDTSAYQQRRVLSGRWNRIALTAVAMICAAAGAFTWYRSRKPEPPPFREMNMTRLTTSGNVSRAAISGDGKYIAYVTADRDEDSVWVRQVGTSSNIRIAALPKPKWIQRIALSPDARYVFYIGYEPNGVGMLYRVPVLGGRPERLLVDVDTGPAFSPDGAQLAFVRFSTPTGIATLHIAKSDGTGERAISSKQSVGAVGQPAWSPDGDKIVWPNRAVEANSAFDALIVSSVNGREETVLPSKKWWGTWGIEWVADGRGLLISAREAPGAVLQLWHLSWPDGEITRVTNDLSDYRGISVSDDDRAAVSVQSFSSSNISILEDTRAARPVQLTTGLNRDDGVYGLSWARNGRIFYSSSAGGPHEIWTISPDGSDQQQITRGGGRYAWPATPLDGQSVVFAGWDQNRGIHLWRVDADGSNLKQLTSGPGMQTSPNVSPDGKWLYYLDSSNSFSVYRIPAHGGTGTLLFKCHGGGLTVARTGDLAGVLTWDPQHTPEISLALISLPDGQVKRRVPAPLDGVFHFAPDARSLVYAQNKGGASNLWMYSLDGGSPKQLTSFTDSKIFDFDISADGRRFVLARGTVAEDVVLISDTAGLQPR